MAEAIVANACMFISKKHMHTHARADNGAAFLLSYLQFMCFIQGLLLWDKDVCLRPDFIHTRGNYQKLRHESTPMNAGVQAV